MSSLRALDIASDAGACGHKAATLAISGSMCLTTVLVQQMINALGRSPASSSGCG